MAAAALLLLLRAPAALTKSSFKVVFSPVVATAPGKGVRGRVTERAVAADGVASAALADYRFDLYAAGRSRKSGERGLQDSGQVAEEVWSLRRRQTRDGCKAP